MMLSFPIVIPAKAGTQGERRSGCPWTPAFAGVTRGEAFIGNMF
jgi:hypothetical protein